MTTCSCVLYSLFCKCCRRGKEVVKAEGSLRKRSAGGRRSLPLLPQLPLKKRVVPLEAVMLERVCVLRWEEPLNVRKIVCLALFRPGNCTHNATHPVLQRT